MEKHQFVLIVVFLCVSVASLLLPAVWCVGKRILFKPAHIKYEKSAISHILTFSGYLIVSVWCLRYAVGYFTIVTAGDGVVTLTWWEEIFNSLAHALQTFSMDEEYTEYIINGKQMLREMFGDDTVWQDVYGLYASTLNFIAPIAGGAIIFEILTSAFPRMKLILSYWMFWKEKCFLSELNDASITLAKSIHSSCPNPWKRPVIIFTDAYSDTEDEKRTELFLEAKSIGAICIRDDLAHIRKNKYGSRSFYLINVEDEGSDNLRTLAALSDPSNAEYLKKSEIYFFTNEDAYVQVEKSVLDKLSFTPEDAPAFIPVRSYRNLITDLLVELPLYEPLVGKQPNGDGTKDLTVTILGTGYIGTEMFLTAYWIGQILNCNLKINVLSQESEEEFWNKIDYINPEIRHTTTHDDPILTINRKGDMADVYCEVSYSQCDVRSSEFVDFLTCEKGNILNTDYFLVSLGSDAQNISVAETLKKHVGKHHMQTETSNKTIITYVVYDDELSDVLNRTKHFSFVKNGCDVYMQAIGSLESVYSVGRVFLTEHNSFAELSSAAYDAMRNRGEVTAAHKKRIKDDYKYWANMARAMHIKYKVFSMGMIKKSIFDYPDSVEEYRQYALDAYEEYKKIISGEFEFESAEHEKNHLELLHRMAWLEHRRWNAFTRIKGFRQTFDYGKYAVSGQIGSYKQMELKLHPCLVECDQKGIRATISSKGVIDSDTLLKCTDRSDFDLLDDLSYDLYENKYNDYDLKQYDYPLSV